MKKRMWTGRVLAFGAALAFMAAAGVGVQAREPESLTEVTEISASAFQALKPEGPVTAEEKHEVIGSILLEAGVPEFMVEKLDDGMIESLYKCPGFEIQIEYSQEEPDGTLKRISFEQHQRITEYNQRFSDKMSSNPALQASGQLRANDPAISNEISNLTHVLIVGNPVNGQRFCWAIAGWNTSPVNRMTDFIGISSSRSTILIDTAVAGMEYTIQTHDGDINKGGSYEFNSTDFVESNYGVGKEIKLPADPLMYSSLAQTVVFCPCKDIVLSIAVWEEDQSTSRNIISNYFHKYFAITFGVEFSGDGAGFSVSPQLAFDNSDVSQTIRA